VSAWVGYYRWRWRGWVGSSRDNKRRKVMGILFIIMYKLNYRWILGNKVNKFYFVMYLIILIVLIFMMFLLFLFKYFIVDILLFDVWFVLFFIWLVEISIHLNIYFFLLVFN
jgi:hypothetical protein